MGRKTVCGPGASKPFPWNLTRGYCRSIGKIPQGSFVFWVPLAINIALELGCEEAQVHTCPADSQREKENCNGRRNSGTKEEICFINSETDDVNG